MSVYLFQRLLSQGSLPAPILLGALELSERGRSAFIEALVRADVRNAYVVARCFAEDGDKADKAWRPDPRLLLDLPPGICERFLAFPFRERSGAIEVATVSPFDRLVQEEFTFHLRRPVALFRANLQALMAAAGAPVDLEDLTHSLSEAPPRAETSPIPLVRRSSRRPKARPRMRTAPGLGEQSNTSLPPSDPNNAEPFQSSPWAAGVVPPLELLDQSRDEQELAHSLSGLLDAPYLILEIGEDELVPRVASSGAGAPAAAIARWEDCVFNIAADEGRYMGPWSPNAIHQRFSHLFDSGDLVRADRIGTLESGLVVVQKVSFDGSNDGEILDRARQAWRNLQERAALFD